MLPAWMTTGRENRGLRWARGGISACSVPRRLCGYSFLFCEVGNVAQRVSPHAIPGAAGGRAVIGCLAILSILSAPGIGFIPLYEARSGCLSVPNLFSRRDSLKTIL